MLTRAYPFFAGKLFLVSLILLELVEQEGQFIGQFGIYLIEHLSRL
jgi:hypothetical protein